jgi:hypothetical protein
LFLIVESPKISRWRHVNPVLNDRIAGINIVDEGSLLSYIYSLLLIFRTNVLTKQLNNYKEIIKLRVADDQPVITYQDNLQMKRTSMRHLRLSKLQKEKMKQNKMWDFTVRGWRVADTDGIEDLFKDKNTAVTPQRKLASLKYEDTKIGKYI